MAAVSTHLQDNIKIQETSDDDPYSPNTRDTNTPDYHDDEKNEERTIHTSSFSIHNVLKKERESHSPENVFSTDKLLQNTPNFEENVECSRNSESPIEEEHSSDFRAEISVDDDNSCCSDDTVLSVGNEAPISSNNNISQEKNGPESPETSGLTSFKHIQTHLNAISQLSQNLNISQPMLVRPNPITPNPLMFLNQPLIFQNPLLNQDLKSGLNISNRLPMQNNLGLNPQPFGLNFGLRSKTQELRSTRTDENRRLFTPKSPENESFINQNCLKFSIDNILKADFGRRITDPLNKRKSLKTRQYEAKPEIKEASKAEVEPRVPEVKPSDKGGAIDLSKGDDSGSNPGSNTG